jgi:neutral ceramidase
VEATVAANLRFPIGGGFRFALAMVLMATCAARSVAEGAATPDIRVGAAAVNLEADDSMPIAGGIGPALSKGQEGELRVVAVVVEKPQVAKIAIVACDVLFVSREIVDPALSAIEKSTGIPAAHVIVNATHTHHAPSTTKIHGYERVEKFCQRLEGGIVAAVQQANAKLDGGEATFGFHLGEEKTVGRNSRLLMRDGSIYWIGPQEDAVRPTGPFDPALPVFAFRGRDDKLRALLYNHSTHTIGTRSPGKRSPSFYGLAAQELESELGGVVGFLEGASGSTHNLGDVAMDDAIGRMKTAVTETLAKAKPRPVDRLRSVKARFTFRVRAFDEETEDTKVATYSRKYAPTAAEKIIDVFRVMRRELKAEQGKARESTIQVMQLGDVALVGVPAEYFTGLGLDIKRRSPFEETAIVELANDWIGYLPDKEAHKLGGYQTWTGFHSYAEEGTGERMADEAVKLLEAMKRAN